MEKIELVSKELNHFGVIAGLFQVFKGPTPLEEPKPVKKLKPPKGAQDSKEVAASKGAKALKEPQPLKEPQHIKKPKPLKEPQPLTVGDSLYRQIGSKGTRALSIYTMELKP